MKKYEFKATELIAQTFEEKGVKFDVVSYPDSEHLLAGFSVDCGPSVIVRFISRDNDNDVAARVFGLISNIPEKKRPRVMDACNILNRKIRHVKFCLDLDGDIDVEYDLLMHSPDDAVGEMAFETFIRMAQILKSQYPVFVKALYTDEEFDDWKYGDRKALAEKLEKLQELLETVESGAVDEVLAADGGEDADISLPGPAGVPLPDLKEADPAGADFADEAPGGEEDAG